MYFCTRIPGISHADSFLLLLGFELNFPQTLCSSVGIGTWQHSVDLGRHHSTPPDRSLLPVRWDRKGEGSVGTAPHDGSRGVDSVTAIPCGHCTRGDVLIMISVIIALMNHCRAVKNVGTSRTLQNLCGIFVLRPGETTALEGNDHLKLGFGFGHLGLCTIFHRLSADT